MTENVVTGEMRRRRGIGIVGRLLLVHGLVMLAAIGAIAVVTHRRYAQRLERDLVEELNLEVDEFERAAFVRPDGQTLIAFADQWVRIHPDAGTGPWMAISLTVPDGLPGAVHVSVTEPSAVLLASARAARVLSGAPSSGDDFSVTIDGRRVKAFGRALYISRQPVGSMVVASALSNIRELGHSQLEATIAESVVAVLVASILAYLVLRRLLRGVASITAAADEISQSNLNRRVAWNGPNDELGVLADTFDRMLDRLASVFGAQSRLLAEVSHQLRTPLTVIRGHLEVQARTGFSNEAEVRESIGTAINELDYVASLVQRLVVYGRAMQPAADGPLVSVAAAVRRAYEAGLVLADREWSLVDGDHDANVRVDPEMLHGALLNLIENAVRATVPGDEIRLATSTSADAHTIEVTDTGRGMSDDELAAVLARASQPVTTRSDDRRSGGLGLGLAIVSALMASMGGTMAVDSSQGRGTTVRLVIPFETRR